MPALRQLAAYQEPGNGPPPWTGAGTEVPDPVTLSVVLSHLGLTYLGILVPLMTGYHLLSYGLSLILYRFHCRILVGYLSDFHLQPARPRGGTDLCWRIRKVFGTAYLTMPEYMPAYGGKGQGARDKGHGGMLLCSYSCSWLTSLRCLVGLFLFCLSGSVHWATGLLGH